jgi:hypothetical protein
MAVGHQIFVIVYDLLAEGSFDDEEQDDHLQPCRLEKSCPTLEKDHLARLYPFMQHSRGSQLSGSAVR